jgi:hypothetical protein
MADHTNAARQARWQARRKEEFAALRARVVELEAENTALKARLAASPVPSTNGGLQRLTIAEQAASAKERVASARGREGKRAAREELKRTRREIGERMRRDLDEGLRRRLWEEKYGKTYRKRLVRVLGMLGSDHEGERDTAGQQAETLRCKLNATWDQLIPNQPTLTTALGKDALAAEQVRRGLGLTWEQLLRI